MKPLAQERASAADAKDTRAHRIDAVVVSSDDALLIELGPILGNRYRTHAVDTPADIATTLHASRWIGIVDTTSMPDAHGAIVRMELQYHRCPIIVITAHPEEWSAAISRGAAAAAISRDDIAGSQLTEALTAAELRVRSDAPAVASDNSSAAITRSRAAGRLGLLAGICAALVVVGAAAWLLYKPHSNPVATLTTGNAAGIAGTVPAPVFAPASTRPQTVLELLSAARVAFGDQKLLLPRADVEPRGDSALELYAQVLAQQPDNDEAVDGVKRLFAAGRARIQSDLSSGKLDDASRLVGYFKAAGVNSAALSDIDASINAAKPKWAATRVQQDIAAGDLSTADQLIGQLTASGSSPNTIAELRRALEAKKLEMQLTTMANQVKAAIAAGTLLDPANDNARTRLTAMRGVGRTSPVTLATQHELQAALLDRAQLATHQGQLDQAQRYVGAATELGSSPETNDARRQLQAAIEAASQRAATLAAASKAQQAAAAAATAPIRAGAAATDAARSGAAIPHYIAGRPTRALSVAYPDNTTAAGYVVIEFTLAPNGTASDLTVVDSMPAGVFDATALSAVRRGRYDTHALVGKNPAKARILLRFKPN